VDADARDPKTRELIEGIDRLAVLVRLQTGHAWFEHPGAAAVLRQAVASRLARMSPPGSPVFQPDELPTAKLVVIPTGQEDPAAIGAALEALDFHQPPMTEERRRKIDEEHDKFRRELIERQQKGQKS
jgi:hypothetical protein